MKNSKSRREKATGVSVLDIKVKVASEEVAFEQNLKKGRCIHAAINRKNLPGRGSSKDRKSGDDLVYLGKKTNVGWSRMSTEGGVGDEMAGVMGGQARKSPGGRPL